MEKWIKSKVVVFFGLNNQFAGMYLVDNQEQVDLISTLVYDFPYYFKVYDDIPRLNESISIQMDTADNLVFATITDIDGFTKKVCKTHASQSLFDKIEELFGNV